MKITYLEDYRLFKLDTEASSYIISVTDEEGFLGHVYYGALIPDEDVRYILRTGGYPFMPSRLNRERVTFMDILPKEYPDNGVGDFKESAVEVETADGNRTVLLLYRSHRIYEGKNSLEGLPATFGSDALTLEITAEDPATGLKAVLSWSIFGGIDAVARSVRLENTGKDRMIIRKAMSASLDMEAADLRMLTLYGSWAREKHMEFSEIQHGRQSVYSLRGISSAQFAPFLGLVDRKASWDSGEVYGFQLVYSGNFLAQVERDQADTIRVCMGINPSGFAWELMPGSSFQTPEAVMVFSAKGLNGMSHNFHRLYMNHLIRSPYRDRKRPILINNWEGTYFDFNTEKLLSIARAAREAGVEMFVMDDGWFGKRDDDSSGLGDWVVNEKKLPGGVKYLADEIHKLRWYVLTRICTGHIPTGPYR